jgi:Sulfotransferase family
MAAAAAPADRRSPSAFPEAARPVRVLYIGGCGRTGSTLLDRIVGQLPGACSAGELVHIWRRGLLGNQLCGCGLPFHECPFWTEVGESAYGGWDALDGERLAALQHQVDRNRYIPLMLWPRLDPSYRRRFERYVDILGRLYRGIQAASGAPVIIDSTKHSSTAYLLSQIPDVDLRVVHLVRDSRGVAYSWTKVVQKPEVVDGVAYMPQFPPLRMAARYDSYNLLFHALSRRGVPTLFMRYEHLVQHPRREVERILDLVPVIGGPEDLEYIGSSWVDLQPAHTVAGNPMRFKQGRLQLRPDEEWRDRLAPKERVLVSAITSPLLLGYGYLGRGDVQATRERRGEET